MVDKKLYKGRPVSTEALDELLENWPIPDVSDKPEKFRGRSTAFGTPLEELYSKKQVHEEPEPQEPEFPTLTLEELEQIRQDAYDEGIKQGHEQGYIEGFEKGVSEGKEAGYKEGVEIGKEKGIEEAQPIIEERMKALSSLLDEMQSPLTRVDDECEKQLVYLVNLLAEQVIFKELKTSPELILNALKKAMDALPVKEQTVRIHLHPEDLELVQSMYGAEHIESQHWQLIPEPTLDRGGCEVKTPQSSIDMTLKNRISEVLESFLLDSGINP
ncbi:flagellar assembly protein FliH [Pseudoalteromonas sp. McH1-7]|uniref:Flagellar assembly protein FliH n=1 Tax=Pseudoalteromonas peptidolytica F12-50-A1 TaxID=1315280 RepID=A0A8I0MWX1_9GAMM|nr:MULTISPECIES: flagellar assembly protein FliH [Pseudoalteromonas]MBE0346858.1 flagellar assembly protein FliH [Pseudoalteromonas peptidolytica F12-50-A1]NLR13760.1 flagellar assembly protein FliH [Pseudoalteromonas peptidolytica]NUZ09565.1 flagellar assembly protein FliH [Pseudoalteromonas sp. McH1-7]RRS09005.1 flagellar assembly protein FliH [Pseudoalteromonas sp. J010]RXF06166.1 flagellar assembly protein FliH [Pseudoalteromonas sp. PS5]